MSVQMRCPTAPPPSLTVINAPHYNHTPLLRTQHLYYQPQRSERSVSDFSATDMSNTHPLLWLSVDGSNSCRQGHARIGTQWRRVCPMIHHPGISITYAVCLYISGNRKKTFFLSFFFFHLLLWDGQVCMLLAWFLAWPTVGLPAAVNGMSHLPTLSGMMASSAQWSRVEAEAICSVLYTSLWLQPVSTFQGYGRKARPHPCLMQHQWHMVALGLFFICYCWSTRL